MKSQQKGFTLIELLVVVAIIGILSSVILTALSTAKQKASDAAVKEAMHNFLTQAEIYYDGTGGQLYNQSVGTSSSCWTGSTVFTDSQSVSLVNNIGASSLSTTTLICSATASRFAISATLLGAGTNWCVDSVGNGTTTSVNTADGLCI